MICRTEFHISNNCLANNIQSNSVLHKRLTSWHDAQNTLFLTGWLYFDLENPTYVMRKIRRNLHVHA